MNLKQVHTTDQSGFYNLRGQRDALVDEINQFITNPPECLVIPANKVYRGSAPGIPTHTTLGGIVTLLAEVNCALWHEQERVYDFVNVPVNEKDNVVQRIATLNLQRNQCIERIDIEFKRLLCTPK